MDRNDLILGQLYSLIVKESQSDVRAFEIFFQKTDYNVNYQIPYKSLYGNSSHWCFNGYTILHFAVSSERKELVGFLLSRDADFTLKTLKGFTPLRLAIENIKNSNRTKLSTRLDPIPVLELLLSAHVKLNNATNPSCNDGISHFHVACLTDNVPAAKFFLQTGVFVNESVKETSDLFPGFSPLHFAVRYGSEDLVKLLLIHGADVNHVDGNGFTPLRLLVERSIEINDFTLLVKYGYDTTEIEQELWRNDTLIDLFINKEVQKNITDDVGLSVFHVSCVKRDTRLYEKLVKCSVDIDCQVNFDSSMWQGYTPAHFAAHCNPYIFKSLAMKNANILATDARGVTPLNLFIERYKLADLQNVLELHPILRNIHFENGIKLFNVISAIQEECSFVELVRDLGVNSRLPDDSPFWPGYTLGHLAVAVSKVTYYPFRHDYFVKKNYFINKNYKYSEVDDELVRKYLHLKDKNLTVKDFNGMTSLHLAFSMRKYKVVRLILQEIFWNITEIHKDQSALYTLHIACIDNDWDLVEKFFECGFDVDSPTVSDLTWLNRTGSIYDSSILTYKSGSTLCHIAAANGCEMMLELVIKAGAKINLLDANGLTAVHVGFLSDSNNERMIEFLLSVSNNSETKITNYTAANAGGLSHLHVACYSRDLASVENLVSVTADINAPIDCETAIDAYAEKLTSYAGWTPLHFATYKSFGEAIDLLISKGADVCIKNAAGLSPLHMSLNTCTGDIIKRLYKELEEDWSDNFGLTKLHMACYFGDKDEIMSLLEAAAADMNKKININSPIWPGETSFGILLRRFWTQDIQFIIDVLEKIGSRFYECNPIDRNGLSHFHISCMLGNVDIVKNFISFGVNIDEPAYPLDWSDGSRTPLHLAVRYGREEVVELLLHRGANWKLEDSDRLTPLQEAALENESTILAVFSKFNVQVDAQVENAFGETVLGTLLTRHFNNLYYSQSYFENFLNNGVRVNFIDPPAKREDIAKIAWMIDNDIFRVFVERAVDVTNIDVSGKNVVHSIGSINNKFRHQVDQCTLNVKAWLDRGCDLNLQDNTGCTPLHDAVNMGGEAIKVLLLLGADVNIRDNQGRTAFSYLNDDDNSMRRLFLIHFLMMSCSGLELSDSFAEIVRRKFNSRCKTRRKCNRDLKMMKNIPIAEGIFMRDLLTEKVIRNFPHYHVSKRDEILVFFRSGRRLDEYYRIKAEWNNIFQHQYHKILWRTKQLKSASDTFYERIFHLDLPCIDLILQNLSNYDLKSLINV